METNIGKKKKKTACAKALCWYGLWELQESQDVYRVEIQKVTVKVLCLHPKSNDWKAKCPNHGHNMFRFPFKEMTLEVVWKADLEAGKSRDSQTRLEAAAVAEIMTAVALDDLVVKKEK